MGRSILAVFAGVITIAVTAIGGDAVMRHVVPGAFNAQGFSDRVPVLLAMLVYMTAFSGLGGWVTSIVTRRTDLKDVWILAALQTVMTLLANIMAWDRRLLWFYALGLVLTPIVIRAGGRLRRARTWQLKAAM